MSTKSAFHILFISFEARHGTPTQYRKETKRWLLSSTRGLARQHLFLEIIDFNEKHHSIAAMFDLHVFIIWTTRLLFFSINPRFLHSQSKQPFVSFWNSSDLNRVPKRLVWSLPWSTKNPSGNQPATPARETKPNLLSTVGDCPFYPGQGTILRSLGHQTGWGAPGNIAWDNKGSFFILPDSSQGTNGAANTPAPGFLLPEDGGVRPRSPSLGYRPLLHVAAALPGRGGRGENPRNGKYAA